MNEQYGTNSDHARRTGQSKFVSLFYQYPYHLLPLTLTNLLNDEDGVVDLLPLEEWVQVVEEDGEVTEAVSVGDDDGHTLVGSAGGRMVVAPWTQLRVLQRLMLQRGYIFLRL